MRLMDEAHLRRSARDSRQMMDFPEDEGHVVDRKRNQRLMRKMALKAWLPSLARRFLVKAIRFIRTCFAILKLFDRTKVNDLGFYVYTSNNLILGFSIFRFVDSEKLM